jgi:hypothetical protein
MVRVDPDPSNRVLPLGLGDLDCWEAWLTFRYLLVEAAPDLPQLAPI